MSAYRMRALTVGLLATLAGVASAEVGNPDHTIYGQVTIFAQPAPAGTEIELRSARDGSVMARYELGRDPRLAGRFALRISMDDAGPRVDGRARPGDPVRAFVDGRLAAETTVGAQGLAVQLDLDPQNMGNVPTLDVANLQLPEGQSGNTPMTFTVVLSTSSDQPSKIDWATREGTAIGGLACGPGVDFVRDQGTAIVPAGATSTTFQVIACGDTMIEADETYFVDLSGADNALAVRSEVTATILDDDDQPSINVADASAAEPAIGTGTLVFTATLSRPSPVNVSFSYATQDQGAIAGSDYAAASGVLTLPAGELAAEIAVTLQSDALTEPEERFRLVLSDPVNVNLARIEAFGRIFDPGFEPEVELHDVELGGDGGIGDLSAPVAIALSPDGKHLYALGQATNAILQFDRGADGRLTFARGYTTQSAGFGNARLGLMRDLELSPDGKFIYVAAEGDDAVNVFARTSSSGNLAFVQFQHEGDADAAAQGGVVRGLDGPVAMALSPDGSQVYVVGGSGDSLAVFSRDSVTGRVSFAEIERNGVDDVGDSGPTVASLDDPSGVVLSPDGAQLYVSVRGSGALLGFARNAADGRVAFASALVDGVAGVDGIAGASALALEPGGAHLYVSGSGDDAIALFDRAGDGTLTWRKHFRKGDAGLAGLGGARAVKVAPDGRQVFALGFDDNSFVVFERSADGDLVPKQTVFDAQGTVEHLAGPAALELSADDLHVYVAAQGDDALLVFRRLASFVLFGDGFESPSAPR